MVKALMKVHPKNDVTDRGIWLFLWQITFKIITGIMTDNIIPEHIMDSNKFHSMSEIFILITLYPYKQNVEKKSLI